MNTSTAKIEARLVAVGLLPEEAAGLYKWLGASVVLLLHRDGSRATPNTTSSAVANAAAAKATGVKTAKKPAAAAKATGVKTADKPAAAAKATGEKTAKKPAAAAKATGVKTAKRPAAAKTGKKTA